MQVPHHADGMHSGKFFRLACPGLTATAFAVVLAENSPFSESPLAFHPGNRISFPKPVLVLAPHASFPPVGSICRVRIYTANQFFRPTTQELFQICETRRIFPATCSSRLPVPILSLQNKFRHLISSIAYKLRELTPQISVLYIQPYDQPYSLRSTRPTADTELLRPGPAPPVRPPLFLPSTLGRVPIQTRHTIGATTDDCRATFRFAPD